MSTLRPLLAPLAPLAFTLVAAALPSVAHADTYTNIEIDGPAIGEVLDARIYVPDALDDHPPAVILLHGCGGLWSLDTPSKGAVKEIERWGRELAAQGYVAIAVDAYGGREPAGATWLAHQYQCSGTTYAGSVNPYTTRVLDIDAARQYLVDEYDVDLGGVGVIGWSQGAQAVMVAMAATPSDEDVAIVGASPYAAAVAYYPGCGEDLGFGYDVSDEEPGYWRPRAPMRLHHGTSDPLHGNCDVRADHAIAELGAGPQGGAPLTWVEYAGVGHTFDNQGTTAFPTTECTSTEWATGGMAATCAMREADIRSLAFLLAEVVAG